MGKVYYCSNCGQALTQKAGTCPRCHRHFSGITLKGSQRSQRRLAKSWQKRPELARKRREREGKQWAKRKMRHARFEERLRLVNPIRADLGLGSVGHQTDLTERKMRILIKETHKAVDKFEEKKPDPKIFGDDPLVRSIAGQYQRQIDLYRSHLNEALKLSPVTPLIMVSAIFDVPIIGIPVMFVTLLCILGLVSDMSLEEVYWFSPSEATMLLFFSAILSIVLSSALSRIAGR